LAFGVILFVDASLLFWPVHGVIVSFLGSFTLHSCIVTGAELHLFFEWHILCCWVVLEASIANIRVASHAIRVLWVAVLFFSVSRSEFLLSTTTSWCLVFVVLRLGAVKSKLVISRNFLCFCVLEWFVIFVYSPLI